MNHIMIMPAGRPGRPAGPAIREASQPRGQPADGPAGRQASRPTASRPDQPVVHLVHRFKIIIVHCKNNDCVFHSCHFFAPRNMFWDTPLCSARRDRPTVALILVFSVSFHLSPEHVPDLRSVFMISNRKTSNWAFQILKANMLLICPYCLRLNIARV